MPTRAPHGCTQPGCPELVHRGARCDTHARARAAEVNSFRGSAASRGYGYRWTKIRGAYLRAHPLCAHCLAEGRTTPATDVDHVTSRARGGSDHASNLQALCHRCHSTKTAAEDGAFGRRTA